VSRQRPASFSMLVTIAEYYQYPLGSGFMPKALK
jgi:hypothetical protein